MKKYSYQASALKLKTSYSLHYDVLNYFYFVTCLVVLLELFYNSSWQ